MPALERKIADAEKQLAELARRRRRDRRQRRQRRHAKRLRQAEGQLNELRDGTRRLARPRSLPSKTIRNLRELAAAHADIGQPC